MFMYICSKTKNGKSNLSETDREKPSPAESGFEGRICEVHPGVDSVKYSIRIRVTHVTCFE